MAAAARGERTRVIIPVGARMIKGISRRQGGKKAEKVEAGRRDEGGGASGRDARAQTDNSRACSERNID